MVKKKSGNFTNEGIESLAKEKPVVYKMSEARIIKREQPPQNKKGK